MFPLDSPCRSRYHHRKDPIDHDWFRLCQVLEDIGFGMVIYPDALLRNQLLTFFGSKWLLICFILLCSASVKAMVGALGHIGTSCPISSPCCSFMFTVKIWMCMSHGFVSHRPFFLQGLLKMPECLPYQKWRHLTTWNPLLVSLSFLLPSMIGKYENINLSYWHRNQDISCYYNLLGKQIVDLTKSHLDQGLMLIIQNKESMKQWMKQWSRSSVYCKLASKGHWQPFLSLSACNLKLISKLTHGLPSLASRACALCLFEQSVHVYVCA